MRPFSLAQSLIAVHLARQPPRVHRHHRAGAGRQLALGVLQVKRRGLRVDVNEDGHAAEEAHRQAGGEERVGRHHDFAAGRQVEREIHAGQRAGAVDVVLHEGRLGVILPLLLERRQLVIELVVVEQAAQGLLLGVAVARPLRERGELIGGK